MRTILLLIIGLHLLLPAGCGEGGSRSSALCESPAPVVGEPVEWVEGLARFIVTFNENVDGEAETLRLSSTYEFEAGYGDYLPGFVAVFSQETLEHLRCEPSIKSIQQDLPAAPN